MSPTDPFELLGSDLSSALAKKGYAQLTPVQEAVLDPAHADRDLRISSQTGSGKTLAIGFTLRHGVTPTTRPTDGIARPMGVVITPTRELAKQVESELAWLYAPSRVLVTSVTGGSSTRDELRSLARGPGILVGTPGRLLDHLSRGSVALAQAGAIVLDEADRMLDLGFRDDLEAILALAPEGHRTHLVSATFPREVEALANRVQANPTHVQGTPLGSANADIDHVVHVVKADQRVDALVNLLLAAPDEQVLAFARTRADVARVCEELDAAGFAVDSLSGEMEQNARHRALGGFKRGNVQILVATDVAARGIDHSDIARVVQLEPPNDADTYTHRSGRTGRAGRKGKSSVLVQPAGIPRLTALLRRAGVKFRFAPIPTAASITAAQDAELFRELAGESADPNAPARPIDERARQVAAELVAAGRAEEALATLIERTRRSGTCTARDVTPYQPPPPPERKYPSHPRGNHPRAGHGYAPHHPHANGPSHRPYPKGPPHRAHPAGAAPHGHARGPLPPHARPKHPAHPKHNAHPKQHAHPKAAAHNGHAASGDRPHHRPRTTGAHDIPRRA